ncbi:hypothetical protein Vretimale_19550 [Volvox reticuliferus]|uniref:Uncharacterized protein n=1 Tax=Volvox reticuliferus TaxID=1737510 RepID=A0A8J4H0T1_9CHLO|nr:hypothetical protein Vretimale_19550 [Volvox reticuliferus]
MLSNLQLHAARLYCHATLLCPIVMKFHRTNFRGYGRSNHLSGGASAVFQPSTHWMPQPTLHPWVIPSRPQCVDAPHTPYVAIHLYLRRATIKRNSHSHASCRHAPFVWTASLSGPRQLHSSPQPNDNQTIYNGYGVRRRRTLLPTPAPSRSHSSPLPPCTAALATSSGSASSSPRSPTAVEVESLGVLKRKVSEAESRLAAVLEVADVSGCRAKLSSLEHDAAGDGLWADAARAQRMLAEIGALRSEIQELDRFRSQLEECAFAVELLESEASTDSSNSSSSNGSEGDDGSSSSGAGGGGLSPEQVVIAREAAATLRRLNQGLDGYGSEGGMGRGLLGEECSVGLVWLPGGFRSSPVPVCIPAFYSSRPHPNEAPAAFPTTSCFGDRWGATDNHNYWGLPRASRFSCPTHTYTHIHTRRPSPPFFPLEDTIRTSVSLHPAVYGIAPSQGLHYIMASFHSPPNSSPLKDPCLNGQGCVLVPKVVDHFLE